jgi:hypothetical protein
MTCLPARSSGLDGRCSADPPCPQLDVGDDRLAGEGGSLESFRRLDADEQVVLTVDDPLEQPARRCRLRRIGISSVGGYLRQKFDQTSLGTAGRIGIRIGRQFHVGSLDNLRLYGGMQA